MADGTQVRRLSRRASVRSHGHACSCDLLVELATSAQLSGFFSELGIDAEAIAQARSTFHARTASEPADWSHRLESRGARAGPQAQHQALLAMVRSADLHAYRLLEHLGLAPGRVRKRLIARISTLAQSQSRAGTSSAPLTPPAPPAAAAPVRMSRRQTPGVASLSSPRQSAALHDEGAAQTHAGRELRAAPSAGEASESLRAIDPSTLPPLLGRERELDMLADALSRSRMRPSLLIGETGCGRSSLARHLARVLDRPVYHLHLSDYADEDSLREDLDVVHGAGGVAVVDDLDRIGGEQAPACLPALTHAWTAGPMTLTIASPEGRGRLQAWLPGVLDTLDTLECGPLERASIVPAVREGASEILQAHQVGLAAGARLENLVRIADTYLGGAAMPGRALDLLDLAAGRALRNGDTELRADHWIDVVCQRTGLPRTRVDGSGDQDALDLDTALARYVVGHKDALDSIAGLVRRNRAGFSSHRPIASVLLLGPSGVGKTEIAKALAAALFDRPDGLLRLDMSEYAEAHAVARVVGAPPGYVGHEQGGALTDPLLAQPHRVVLLDEIEKAHRDVHQLMLQVFDEGRLTDGRGRTVDFRHAVVIMTSNLGAPLMEADPTVDGELVLDEARAAFPVELWNRIEAPLALRPLSAADLHKVCKRLISTSSRRLEQERGISYSLHDSAAARLVDLAGEDPALGARPLRHLVAREIESMIADQILRGQLRAGDRVMVDFGAKGFGLRRA